MPKNMEVGSGSGEEDLIQPEPIDQEFERKQKSKQELLKNIAEKIYPEAVEEAVSLHPQFVDTLAFSCVLDILSDEQKKELAKNLGEVGKLKYSSKDYKKALEAEKNKPGEGLYWKANSFYRENVGESGHDEPIYAWFVKTEHGDICLGQEFHGDRSNAAGEYDGFDFSTNRHKPSGKKQGK